MTLSVPGLMLRSRLGQTEGSPVCVAADDAAGAEDLDSSVTGDSADGVSMIFVCFNYSFTILKHDSSMLDRIGWTGGTYSRTSLRLPGRTCEKEQSVQSNSSQKSDRNKHTTAISSYNISAAICIIILLCLP